jgi:cyanophycinase
MRDPAIFTRFIELAGGPDAELVMIPTAGGEDDYDGEFPGLERWRDAGARNITVLHTTDPREAESRDFWEPLTTADGVFFFGGRQWRLVQAYAGTRTELEIRRVLDRGGVVGGSSAGASIQGSYLVRGDTETNTRVMGDHEIGFGYLRNVGIDQHVLRRNRHFDLIELVERHPELLGIGIDEDTALIVEGDEATVLGQSYVLIFDNQVTVGEGGSFYFLSAGDRIDLATREVSGPTQRRGFLQHVKPKPRGPGR